MHFSHFFSGAMMAATSLASPPAIHERQAANYTMGFIGCSMAENVAQGYVAVNGKRMWGPYGTSGMVVQSWTSTTSASWKLFDQQVSKHGKPTAVWVQICIFTQGATYDEIKQMVANAKQHAAADAQIYVSGQPLYDTENSCALAGPGGPRSTDTLAQKAGNDTALGVKYVGQFHLKPSEVQDGCHANAAGQKSLGQQAVAFWG